MLSQTLVLIILAIMLNRKQSYFIALRLVIWLIFRIGAGLFTTITLFLSRQLCVSMTIYRIHDNAVHGGDISVVYLTLIVFILILQFKAFNP